MLYVAVRNRDLHFLVSTTHGAAASDDMQALRRSQEVGLRMTVGRAATIHIGKNRSAWLLIKEQKSVAVDVFLLRACMITRKARRTRARSCFTSPQL
jgi:hypothetical protein